RAKDGRPGDEILHRLQSNPRPPNSGLSGSVAGTQRCVTFSLRGSASAHFVHFGGWGRFDFGSQRGLTLVGRSPFLTIGRIVPPLAPALSGALQSNVRSYRPTRSPRASGTRSREARSRRRYW